MTEIICNSIEYVFAETIAVITPQSVTLEHGISWKYLPVKEKPIYSYNRRKEDAGPILEETVTAVTKSGIDGLLKRNLAHGVVLRMKTNQKTFHVGTDRYPCTVELSGDGITDTWTFTTTSAE